jgi:hypothetical protein
MASANNRDKRKKISAPIKADAIALLTQGLSRIGISSKPYGKNRIPTVAPTSKNNT